MNIRKRPVCPPKLNEVFKLVFDGKGKLAYPSRLKF
jgi:hypothetical protein